MYRVGWCLLPLYAGLPYDVLESDFYLSGMDNQPPGNGWKKVLEVSSEGQLCYLARVIKGFESQAPPNSSQKTKDGCFSCEGQFHAAQ